MEKAQRYYSKIPGSKFIFPDGKEIFFNHGFFDLKPEDYVGEKISINSVQGQERDKRDGKDKFTVYKDELDGLIKAGNPLLYVQGTQPEALPKMATDANAKSEADIIRASAAEKNVVGTTTGDKNTGIGGLSDPNASTVDPELKAQVLANSGAAAAAKIQALKTAAAQKGASSNS